MIQTFTMIFKKYLREKNALYELERTLLTKRVHISQLSCIKNEDGVFKCYQAVTLTTKELDCLADNYSKNKKMVKKQTGEKTSSYSSSSSAVNDKHHKKRYTSNDQSVPKKNSLKVVMKTRRMMNTRIIKSVELLETEKKRLNNLI